MLGYTYIRGIDPRTVHPGDPAAHDDTRERLGQQAHKARMTVMAWELHSVPRSLSTGERPGTDHFLTRTGAARHITALVDDELSIRLLGERVRLEKILLEGVPAGEGHGPVEEVARIVAEKSRVLSNGIVVALVYTSTGDEVWIVGRSGRIAVAVNGTKKLHGHEALSLYRDTMGEYIMVMGNL